MNSRFATLTLIATLLLGCASIAFAQSAQDFQKPILTTLPQHPQTVVPAKNLTQWNGSFTDLTHVKRTFHYGRHESQQDQCHIDDTCIRDSHQNGFRQEPWESHL